MKIYDKSDNLILDVVVDDNSYRIREIMGEHSLVLYYSLPEHVEIPTGAYCEFEGERYTLMRPEQIKMKHTRLYEYTVTFSASQDKTKIWKFRNTVDGRLKFPYTAKPKEHLQMVVDNMNRHDSGWTVGDCIDDVEKLISYDHDYCLDALVKIADEFKTEYEIIGKSISLHKVEYDKSNPLPLSYGRGNGFKTGIGRSNSGEKMPTEILFVQGGEKNIDRSKYPADETLRASSNGCLLLPAGQTIGYDGEHFEDEAGYATENARHYQVDSLGLSIRNIDKQASTEAEDSLDRSDDYPKRTGTVSRVIEVDKDKNFYDIIDDTIPEELNYEDYLIGEEQMTIIFQSGELAGREFDVKYYHNAQTINGTSKAGRRFEIVPQEIDGVMMPGGSFVPEAGKDTYIVFNVMLPDTYIRNDADKSGAEWDMFRAAVKYLFDNEEEKYTFSGELDGIWAKKDWENIGAKIRLGGFIRFTNEQFEKDGVHVRITSIKDYINRPHSPKIELSNETVSGSVSSTIKQLESTEVLIEENHKTALQYTKRRYRDAKETIEMLAEALSDNFTNSINPIAVETMSLLVGDERLQFQFVSEPGSTEAVPHNINWNSETKQLEVPAGTIQHMTLNIDNIKPSHEASEYMYWNVEALESSDLEDGTIKYYLYIKAAKNYTGAAGNAIFRLETLAHKIEEGEYYWFLVGVLNTEYDGERSFATLYGFTEILPGRVTADRLVSSDGQSYFDMLNAALKLKDKLQYNVNGDGQLKLKGVLVQSQNGIDEVPIGCFRGEYKPTTTYYNGDEVTYKPDEKSPTSTYRCTSSTAITGIAPTNSLYWQVAAAGVQGEPGLTPNASYKSTVFYRSNNTPSTPTGGTFLMPIPTGWSDGIPAGEAKLWASTRIFSSDGKLPQQDSWSTPRQMTDTADFDVEYSSLENPEKPIGHPNTNTQWSNESDENTIWMATSKKNNGEWEEWQVSRIKGEKGQDGTSISIKGSVSLHFLTKEEYLAFIEKAAYLDKYAPYIVDTYDDVNCAYVKALRHPVTGNPEPQVTATTIGDCYVTKDTNHLWMSDGEKWIDCGQFKGDTGTPGNYTEYRFAINGSTITPPSIENNALTPSGWTTEMPAVSKGYYLWVTKATKSGDGTQLISTWSTPVRMTPQDGADGKDGKSPALVFRGIYDSTKDYYGNEDRVDCVQFSEAYYIARIDAGIFKGIEPTSTSKWNTFGASFESVATGLLLAENANIANLIFRNERLESKAQTDGIANFFIDGLKNIASFAAGKVVFDGKGSRIGWIFIEGKDLVGVDEDGAERLRLTPNSLPSANLAGKNETLIVKAYGGDATFTAETDTEVSFEYSVFYDDGTIDNNSEESTTLYGFVEYDIAEDNTRIDLTSLQTICNLMNNNGNVISSEKIREQLYAKVLKKNGTKWNTVGDVTLSEGQGEITVPAGRIRVEIYLSVYVTGYNLWNGTVYVASQGFKATTIQEEVFIAKNGIMAIYNANYLRFHSGEGFTVNVGKYGLRITTAGIQKTTNGGTSWIDL